jgi:hypothetical protein
MPEGENNCGKIEARGMQGPGFLLQLDFVS